ncbi:hypothetical protein ABZX30_13615 [Streptomyces sp. NPDC004542]|uniref:hypothetical protein n=1 Tax=Streptomyces sp. NPDC004542 TaxID=3154281 RepID=UPI0033AD1986
MSSTPAVTPAALREAIAGALHVVKAYDLAAACEYLGLEPQKPGEDPFSSKRIYVRSRLQKKTLSELVDIARRVISEYGDDDLQALVSALGARGVDGEMKNLIFAADGPKPQVVLPDSISNTIRIVKNEQYCLVYDQPLEDRGLSWSDLVAWWVRQRPELAEDATRARVSMRERLRRSLGNNGAELLVFDTYTKLGFDLPALIPQVYLHYDPYSLADLNGVSRLTRQRMDFLLLMNQRARAVIEVDGVQHYARQDDTLAMQRSGTVWLADPARYAPMVAEDRQLTLQGYEVYRIGGHELRDHAAGEAMLTEFFQRLLSRHGHLQPQ